MKKQLKQALLATAIGMALGSPAHAQFSGGGGVGYVGLPNSGIIHFFGRVRDAACTATVNGRGATGYVILPDSMVGNFPTIGSTYGDTPFFIRLDDCIHADERSASAANALAWPYFFAGHSNSVTGRLNNIPGIGQAIGIDLELGDAKSNPFKVYQGALPFGNQGPTGLAFSGSQFDYTVRYYRTAGITPGAIRSNVDYIVYFQ